jgi:hypothetical protein
LPLPATITRDNQKIQPQQTKPLPTSIIRDNHPVKRGRRIHPDRRPLSSELSHYKAEPHNATVLALASYVYSFALRKYAVGHELAELSIKSNAAHPLGHAFLGRAKSYLGEHDAGYTATRRGLELSGQGPYRY